MAEFSIHMSQAKHNESLAEFLLDKPYFDWSITACFYAAIHFVEARLFCDSEDESNKHSETSIPIDDNGKFKYSSHTWRAIQISDRYSRDTWKAFRSLKEASETARYLSHYVDRKTANAVFEVTPSFNIFTKRNSEFSLNQDLASIKKELKLELLEFLFSLEMDKTDWVKAGLIKDKIIQNFITKEEIVGQTQSSLRRYLSREQVRFLEQHLNKKGLSLNQET